MSNEEIWELSKNLMELDNLETSELFNLLKEKQINGEISKEDMLKILINEYKQGDINE